MRRIAPRSRWRCANIFGRYFVRRESFVARGATGTLYRPRRVLRWVMPGAARSAAVLVVVPPLLLLGWLLLAAIVVLVRLRSGWLIMFGLHAAVFLHRAIAIRL